MYCGSCMRDNTLAAALKRAGHEVTLIPLYTPLRTDAPDAGSSEVYYGGVNVFLQHATGLFRHTPRMLDSLLDRPWLLNLAGRFGAQTPPEKLGGLTMDLLEGEDGHAVKELHRLLEFLRTRVRPQVVSLPNLMFIGMARTFARELAAPVVCELTGEDIFLDAMRPEDQSQIRQAIRRHAPHVTRFIATSDDYAGRMAAYLDVPRDRVDVVHSGIEREYFESPAPLASQSRPPTIGYLARICPEKGLSRLLDGFLALRQVPDMQNVRLKVAGYLGARDRHWFADLQARIVQAGGADAVEYLGEVDRAGKLAMLDSIDVLSVPTVYPESKGIYVLEALARGVPVVQPEHGSFPELIRRTGGGVLVPPDDAQALAAALADLLRDPRKRHELGVAGRASVRREFTDEQMAANIVRIYEAAMSDPPLSRTTPGESSRPDPAGGELEVRDVWKQYSTPTEPLVVLRGVSLSLSSGQSLAIVGPSGSGKSTLLNILGTLDQPTRGTLRLGDTDPFALKAGDLAGFRSRRIGFVFQDHHLLPQCTALENVLVARLPLGRVGDDDANRAAELLRRVGLADRARHLPSELSGGERQRVAIARALMNAPQLLLCDEPTGNLDQKSSHAVTELLLELADQNGAILITVTHSSAVAAMFGRQMRMADGVLIDQLSGSEGAFPPLPPGEGRGEGEVEAPYRGPHPSPLPEGEGENAASLPEGEGAARARLSS
jgi:ABC-type lipoprotein export system ATPase subunit/glycosyltransferase involved in cell wall biosynthesis